jgi:tetratricopeptide (TPR) repeat protein
MIRSLNEALTLNTNHTESYILLADHLVDGEEYQAASDALDDALRVNPWLPTAWSYKAVLAHLQNDAEGEKKARDMALRYWTNNPAVDHLIGRKLSQKYRFAEGEYYQRAALRFDPKYLPAKIQLAQDLMRLGVETEGWRLAEQVSEADEYDVTAYNLVTLKEGLDDFQTLTNRDFVLRMGQTEAAIYGSEALALLQQAKDTLCAKYGMELERPTIVEIFPNQNDFGVRTFGMPHNPGFLGVCFGSVITANSPASQGANPSNWKAVLWHEFCHVVTLQMTRNKMPRWLSEGISVYEELQENPTWGQIMNPRYREMVLEGELTPVSDLSAAFLTAPSDMHMQFAYYQSYLVVEFLVQRFGMDSLKSILRELGQGMDINVAIEKQTADLETIEKDFEAYAIAKAEALGPELEWDRPDAEEILQARPEWLEKHSMNYYVLLRRVESFLKEEQWEEAKAPLQTLLEHYPDQIGPSSAYNLLALVHRKLDETDDEIKVLKKLVIQDGDAVDAYQRLMDLGQEAEDWKLVLNNANRYLAVNPMVTLPHRYRAQAAEALEQDELAIRSLEILLRLEISDLADVHFRLARLKHKRGDPSAKRHVLQALEEAPRFREAHRLLLEIRRTGDSS